MYQTGVWFFLPCRTFLANSSQDKIRSRINDETVVTHPQDAVISSLKEIQPQRSTLCVPIFWGALVALQQLIFALRTNTDFDSYFFDGCRTSNWIPVPYFCANPNSSLWTRWSSSHPSQTYTVSTADRSDFSWIIFSLNSDRRQLLFSTRVRGQSNWCTPPGARILVLPSSDYDSTFINLNTCL